MPGQFERHARSKWEWGTPGARSQEVQAAAGDDPEPVKRPAGRKDTRHWCKGKPGVEHVPQLTLHSPFPWKRGGPCCRWVASWSSRDGEYAACWSCDHRETCSRCGKVLRDPIPAGECPAYPGTPQQRAVTEAEARAIKERVAQRRRWSRKPVITGPQGYRRKR